METWRERQSAFFSTTSAGSCLSAIVGRRACGRSLDARWALIQSTSVPAQRGAITVTQSRSTRAASAKCHNQRRTRQCAAQLDAFESRPASAAPSMLCGRAGMRARCRGNAEADRKCGSDAEPENAIASRDQQHEQCDGTRSRRHGRSGFAHRTELECNTPVTPCLPRSAWRVCTRVPFRLNSSRLALS